MTFQDKDLSLFKIIIFKQRMHKIYRNSNSKALIIFKICQINKYRQIMIKNQKKFKKICKILLIQICNKIKIKK